MKRNALVGTNHKAAALWNRGLVMRLLREHKTLSRSQIVDITGLRGSTLTYIVRELIDRGVLQTGEKLTSKNVGQKQVLLHLNPHFGYAVGISVRPGVAHVVVVDAAEERVAAAHLPITEPLDKIPAELREKVESWLSDVGTPQGRLLGVGVGVPGVVDTTNGRVLHSTPFNARQVPLQQLLAEQFQCPVQIDHDACFGALAEADGAAQNVSHFIYFAINHNRVGDVIRLNSFGSALFLEGHVYRGAHYAAGELSSGLRPQTDLLADESDMMALATADADLTQTLQVLAQSTGGALADMVNFLDTEMVVIGGNCNIVNANFLHAVQTQAQLMLIPIPGREIRVIASQLREDTAAQGAAIAACRAALEGGSILNEAGFEAAAAPASSAP